MRLNIRRDLRVGRRTRTLFASGLLILSPACGFAQPTPERQACAGTVNLTEQRLFSAVLSYPATGLSD
jgi:hypothetical protein